MTKFGQAIGPRGIQHLVRKYMAEMGDSPFCAEPLQGTSLRIVQEVLGHASLKTTSIYVQLAQEAVKRELQEHAL